MILDRLVRGTLACACALLGVGAIPAVLAAEEEKPAALEEIIVTATRRPEPLQSVPISITAFTQDNLQRMGADNFADYAGQVPSLMFAERESGRNQIVLRGLSPVVGVSTVGYYLDGISTEIIFESPDPKLFDIERIEILRGPQGTLYGAGAVGGLIRVITNRADPAGWDAAAEAEYFSTDGGDSSNGFSGMLNVPLVEDKLAVRLVGLTRDIGGWINAPLIDKKNANDEHTDSIRASVTWLASDNFEATLRYYYQKIDFGIDSFDSPQQAKAAGYPSTGVSAVPVPVKYSNDANQTSLDLVWRLGFANLEWITGYNATDIDQLTPFPIIDDAAVPPVVLFTFGAPLTNEYRFTTSELRLVSQGDSPWQWVGGLYYKRLNRDAFYDLDTNLEPVAGFGQTVKVTDDHDLYAIFGEVSRRFADNWTLTLGGRYYHESYDTTAVTSTYVTDLPRPYLVEAEKQHGDDNPFAPKIGLDYRVNDDLLYYGIIGKGVRSGGANVDIGGSPAFQPTYKSDSAWSYEIGMKSQWYERRLTFNTAAFYVSWDNLQIDGVPGQSATGFITNGGKAHTTGIEMELQALVAEHWLFDLGGNWVEAKTDDAYQGPSGQWLPNVPEYMFNAGVEYSMPLGTLEGRVRADYSYRDGSYGDLPNRGPSDPLSNYAGSYGILNARMSLEGAKWTAVLYCDNINNSDGSSFSFMNPVTYDEVYRVRPRNYGVKVSVHLK
jgi:iron complex outermembrane recepter protein